VLFFFQGVMYRIDGRIYSFESLNIKEVEFEIVDA
jgi:hypothetical protein